MNKRLTRYGGRISDLFVLGAFVVVPLLFMPLAWGDDSAYFAFSALDDGSCPNKTTLEFMTIGYSHESDTRSANGHIRQAPSGGNCESEALTINLEVEQRFGLGAGDIEGLLKIGYDKRSVSALYGSIATRPDGKPAFAASFPAGVAETPTANLGITYANFDLGYNPLNVDWSDGSQSGTVHFGYSNEFDLDFASLETRLSYDVGNDAFGDASVALVKSFADSSVSLRIGYDYAWGMTALDAGVPMQYQYQSFSGDNALLLQGTQDNYGELSLGMEFALDL